MSDWIYLFIAISGLSFVGIATILVRLGSYIEQLKAVIKKENDCPIDMVEKAVIRIDTKLDIFLKSMNTNLADALRQHNKLERDVLTDKMARDVANQDELNKLATLLRNDFIEEDDGDYPNVKAHKLALANLMAIVDVKLKERLV